ncbi:molybdopterin molybdotransferase MoeA [Qipengyuania marisflavi]|uniref:Molybdopterin molybdenumtransferase n=1 Tax=Qipengyuania marisflavi TaxID=2486356 RepID=A0A5S3P0A3_9SPHN|nr:molybdopterin molybdotransferase MoeA [Qipengyuania marisflavi]TMM46117.1 molybdopterin molybdotransferase MoeA [Qipengyuania marisflavi]
MISFDKAQCLMAQLADPLGSERVCLHLAQGRVLADDLTARIDAPRADVSAMDGYALAGPHDAGAQLSIVGNSAAGAPWDGTLKCGQALRILTGAFLPAGGDRVLIQENAEASGGRVRIVESCDVGAHIRKQGSDFAAGDVVLARGARLGARALVTTASADVDAVTVTKRPRLALLATGDELVSPGVAASHPHNIPDSISPGVGALARGAGAAVVALRRGGDDPKALSEIAGELLKACDVLVVIGGASVGDRDFAREMLDPHGLALTFSKVAIKPGKPVWLGTAGGRIVLGLPGNPTSAMVTARLFLTPLIVALMGQLHPDPLGWMTLPLAAPLPATAARETFARARWEGAGLVPLIRQDSGLQAALAGADWLIRCPPGQSALAAGATVQALRF